MLFVELATQGVMGLPGGRILFRPGYNQIALRKKADSQLFAAIIGLLFDGGMNSASDSGAEQGARASLVVQDDSGVFWRLVRSVGQFGNSKRSLQKAAHSEGASWQLVTAETSEIDRFVRGSLGMPNREWFEQLFLLANRSSESSLALFSDLAPGSNGMLQNRHEAAGRPSVKFVLEEKQLEEKQRQLEAIEQRLLELSPQTRVLESLSRHVAELRSITEKGRDDILDSPGMLQEGLAKAQKYDAARKKLDGSLAELSDEEQSLKSYVEPLHFFRDWRFWLASVLGAVALFSGLALRATEARAVALIAIIAFGAAAIIALKWVAGSREKVEREGRASACAGRRQKLQAAFDSQFKAITSAMVGLGFDRAEPLVERLTSRKKSLEDLKSAEDQLAAANQQAETRAVLAEQEALSNCAKELRSEIENRFASSSPGGAAFCANSAKIEASAPTAESRIARLAYLTDTLLPQALGELSTKSEADSGAAVTGERHLSDFEPEKLRKAVRELASNYLNALSCERLSKLELGPAGEIFVTGRQVKVPLCRLDQKSYGLVSLAVRLAAMELVVSIKPLPILIENEPMQLEAHELQIVSGILKGLARRTQILRCVG